MKNKITIILIAVIIAAIGFSMTACAYMIELITSPVVRPPTDQTQIEQAQSEQTQTEQRVDNVVSSDSSNTVVYIAGRYLDRSGLVRWRACYWKDGEFFPLGFPEGGLESVANSIFVYEGSVYVAGYCDIMINSDIIRHAVYWKNGEIVLLPSQGFIAEAHSIVVSEGSVYVAGTYRGTPIACYWKDGVRTDISGFRCAKAIAVSGSNIHIAGDMTDWLDYTSIGYPSKTYYWRNGTTATQLPWGMDVSSIALSGNDVYIAGSSGMDWQAVYWKNGTQVELNGRTATSIAVSGNNIYVAGYFRDSNHRSHACYWKDGERILLPVNAGESASFAEAIVVAGGSVYVMGSYDIGVSINSTNTACYWKDGVIQTMQQPESRRVMMTSLFVVEK
ncbi:MAG: hypothetical protein LBC80_09375 [Treponema sp.]|jgi:hypothetical protein|nr:hypothetical protein [Treponema sp.]